MKRILVAALIGLIAVSLALSQTKNENKTIDSIYYIRAERNSAPALYQVSVLGGASRRVMRDAPDFIALSPDGKQFAFVRGDPAAGDSSLMIANAPDGSVERRISDIGPERMLTLLMNRNVLNPTPEQSIEWLNSFFLLRWLDGVNDYLPRWRISKARGLQVLGQVSDRER